MIISANEVKKRGVSIFDELLDTFSEVIINFRGKKKYVVIDYERYQDFREYELEKAYKEVMADIENGDYHTDMDRHIKEIENVWNKIF